MFFKKVMILRQELISATKEEANEYCYEQSVELNKYGITFDKYQHLKIIRALQRAIMVTKLHGQYDKALYKLEKALNIQSKTYSM